MVTPIDAISFLMAVVGAGVCLGIFFGTIVFFVRVALRLADTHYYGWRCGICGARWRARREELRRVSDDFGAGPILRYGEDRYGNGADKRTTP